MLMTLPLSNADLLYTGRNGRNNETVNVSFADDVNDTWRREVMKAANTVENETKNYPRKLKFVQKSTANKSDGIHVQKAESLTGDYLAVASSWIVTNTSNGQVFINYSRITINDSKNWTNDNNKVRFQSSAKGDTGLWDMQNVMLHEIGHTVGLDDQYHTQDSIMYLGSGRDMKRRHLSNFDKADLRTIYNQTFKVIENNTTNQNKSNNTTNQNKSNNGVVGAANSYQSSLAYLKYILSLGPQSSGSTPSEEVLNAEISADEISIDGISADKTIEIQTEICYTPMNDELMVESADLIIKGTVKEISSPYWDGDPDEFTSIYHNVVIDVDEVLKEESEEEGLQEIHVQKMGGEIGNVKQTTQIPDYAENQEVLLYLIKSENTTTGESYYFELNDQSQFYIINEELATNAQGDQVNLQDKVDEIGMYQNQISVDEIIEIQAEINYMPMNDELMVESSDLIIKGTVKEILSPYWDVKNSKQSRLISQSISNFDDSDDEIAIIYHDVVIDVNEILKGELEEESQEIHLQKMGGTVGNVKLTTQIPDYDINQEVLLYLLKSENMTNGKSYYTYIELKDHQSQFYIINEELTSSALQEKMNEIEMYQNQEM